MDLLKNAALLGDASVKGLKRVGVWIKSELLLNGKKINGKVQGFLKLFLAYITFIGVFGFALFIAQEGVCMICWANFTALDTNRYDLVKKNYETIEEINNTFKKINDWCMWLNPFQQWGYTAYSDSTEQYVETMRAMCLARAPELFVNQSVDMQFSYRSVRRSTDAPEWLLTNGRITAAVGTRPEETTTRITGILKKTDNGFFVRNRPPDE